MKLLLFVHRWLTRITGWLIIFFLSVMIVMAFGQVVLRNFFHTSIEWGDFFLRHLVLWLEFLGAIIATGEGRHLKIEFINKLAPERYRKGYLRRHESFCRGHLFLFDESGDSVCPDGRGVCGYAHPQSFHDILHYYHTGRLRYYCVPVSRPLRYLGLGDHQG